MVPYPFKPKSTAHIQPGDFWALPLSEGRYGCGRVISLKQPGETGARTMLLVGLMDWVGHEPPSAIALAGSRTVVQGEIHLRSIWETGGEILGHRPLEEEQIVPDFFLSESPGKNCMLMLGYQVLRHANDEEQRALPVFSTWGYLVIQRKAEDLAKKSA